MSYQKQPAPRPTLSSDFTTSTISIPYSQIVSSRRQLQTSYTRFLSFHILALLPTVLMLLTTLLGTLSLRELCHLQDPAPLPLALPTILHSVYQKGQCVRILDSQLLLSTLALGLVGWLASYTSRKACLAFADRIIPRLFTSSIPLFSRSPRFQFSSSEAGKDGIIVTVAIAMQAVIGEALRVLSFYWACCILVTALYLYPIQERESHTPHHAQELSATPIMDVAATGPDWAWRLSSRDPRFFVAAWSSIAWALAEFGSGAFQILHQVALYNPADMLADADDDVVRSGEDDLDGRTGTAEQSEFSLLSGRPDNNRDINQTCERRNGKARRMSASHALESARQRLINPCAQVQQLDSSSKYGAIEEQALETQDESDTTSQQSGSSFSQTSASSLLDAELEEQVERFLVAKERSEVEAVLGVPLPDIPVALCALWRMDAMLWSIGSSLLLSASFTHAQGGLGHLSHDRFDLSSNFHLLPPFDGFGLTFGILVLLHTIVSSLWATSLPYLGFATITYASLLFGLAIMVAALARWGLLI
ncbi:uncharacterized protein MEPE_03442 [Melanopsichium pennsylvanicum]|uniref:Uncharacterized protein n=2 Tax=Melanopsichium pennsylvanicum TaxID=63383 RepID=A0AAJ5C5M9_9BASI|nr:putative protein [Melanopsichium pennsylvanicum 4]SNX84733.1 uncharacterized protein MEPE_03442 [Melanopsichium pennsylvanicum]